jgi:NAD+ synthase (glutamine-hydrolysing)
LCAAGRQDTRYRKGKLPNYGVFDERRYFNPGAEPLVVEVKGLAVAVTIFFDIWNIKWLREFLEGAGRIQMILNISASPFHTGKIRAREKIIDACAKELNCAVAYCNLVGGQDELIFDGRSIFADSAGRLVAKAKAFEEDLIIADVIPAANGTVQIKPCSPAQQRRLILLMKFIRRSCSAQGTIRVKMALRRCCSA